MPTLNAETICSLQSPYVFDKYCSHSGMCSFGQKIPDTYLNSEPSAASRPPRPEKHPESIYYPYSS